jgi:hypothetical protein
VNRISGVIDETRNLADVWDEGGLDERRTLLDSWVLDVLIAVEPTPGMKKANEKTVIVTLRSAPDAPRYFMIGDPSSARPTSSRTHGPGCSLLGLPGLGRVHSTESPGGVRAHQRFRFRIRKRRHQHRHGFP